MYNYSEEFVRLEIEFGKAKDDIKNGRYNDATNKMRRIGEMTVDFYLNALNLFSDFKTYREKKVNEGKSTFFEADSFCGRTRYLKTVKGNVWRKKLTYNSFKGNLKKKSDNAYSIYSSLLLEFFEFVREFGNIASHYGNIEGYQARFLVQMFEDYFLDTLEEHFNVFIDSNEIVDVTRLFEHTKISIKSIASNKYLSACLDLEDDGSPVRCHVEVQDAWETFEVYISEKENGYASLRAFNGKFLMVNIDYDSENPPIGASAQKPDRWERIKIYRVGGYYAIKAYINNKWFSCIADNDYLPLKASCGREDVQLWEQFDINVIGTFAEGIV